ncbi:hypothetical protein RI129_007854 [Pyrocoelia pectoralis]|uniref:MOSC domain-containing protein n=1 Tax=Pyrocoelia pectoralis TaxID=417401 RepID=A0AAN7VH74_9COLE
MVWFAKTSTLEIILGVATIGIASAFVISWYQKRKKEKPPTIWEAVGVVKNLYLYPLKSGKYIELQTALCTEYGVKMPTISNIHQLADRSFVVYNPSDKKFQTARTIPQLVLITMSAVGHDRVQFTAPNVPNLVIKVPNALNDQTVTIRQHHEERILAIDCGDEAAEWISQYALEDGTGLRIAYHDGKQRRNINVSHQNYLKTYSRISNAATGLHSDLSSYMLMNEASVNDLRDKMSEPISVLNFRPNILVEGVPAFAEDDWKWVKIGDVILYTARWCTRCLLTTVDPSTGIKSATNEPLKTLRTYRMLKNVKNVTLDGESPIMGINMGYHSGQKINVGDVVYVGR